VTNSLFAAALGAGPCQSVTVAEGSYQGASISEPAPVLRGMLAEEALRAALAEALYHRVTTPVVATN
jgi:hypothetical protein